MSVAVSSTLAKKNVKVNKQWGKTKRFWVRDIFKLKEEETKVGFRSSRGNYVFKILNFTFSTHATEKAKPSTLCAKLVNKEKSMKISQVLQTMLLIMCLFLSWICIVVVVG